MKVHEKYKWSLKIKMGNVEFVDEGDIPLVHQDNHYDDYRTPNVSRVED